jgi:hypothetical protein
MEPSYPLVYIARWCQSRRKEEGQLKNQNKGRGKRTALCTIEHRMSSTESVMLDSGTQAGSHVPVGVLRSMAMEEVEGCELW